jgi:hypothetical protein
VWLSCFEKGDGSPYFPIIPPPREGNSFFLMLIMLAQLKVDKKKKGGQPAGLVFCHLPFSQEIRDMYRFYEIGNVSHDFLWLLSIVSP